VANPPGPGPVAAVVLAGFVTACTYGNDAAVYRQVNLYYPPVGYVLQAQPASNTVCGPGTVPVYQTFWTHDVAGRFNPVQQYVCAPAAGGRSRPDPTVGYPAQPVAPLPR
jgi:hypothetical protein